MNVKRGYICEEIAHAPRECKIQIGTIIHNYNPDLLQVFGDGIRVNLVHLPDDIVERIYDYMTRQNTNCGMT